MWVRTCSDPNRWRDSQQKWAGCSLSRRASWTWIGGSSPFLMSDAAKKICPSSQVSASLKNHESENDSEFDEESV